MNKCKDITNKLHKELKTIVPKDKWDTIPDLPNEEIVSMLEQMIGINSHLQRVNKLSAVANARFENYIKAVPEGQAGNAFMDAIAGGAARPKTGTYENLTKTGQEDLMIYMTSLERHIEHFQEIGESMMAEASEKFRLKTRDLGKQVLGFEFDKGAQPNLLRAIYAKGLSGDDQANQIAKAWMATHEIYRKMFNRYGGNMPKLESYNLPQRHNSVRIRKVNKDEWVEDVKRLVNLKKLIRTEDGTPVEISAKKINKLLGDVYHTITTENAHTFNIKQYSEFAYSPLYSRHQEHRILHFEDAEKWMEYADKYGSQDYYQGMMGHLEMMSREIAAMKMFGPNPDLAILSMQKRLQKTAKTRDAGALAAGTYELMMGRQYALNVKLSDTMNMVRNLSLIPKIGSAVISAISDIAFFTKTLQFNGLPIVKAYGRILKNLNPAEKVDRVALAKIGLGSDYALSTSRTANRFSQVTGYGWAAKATDFAVRASGLSHWSYTFKNVLGLEYSSHLADLSGKTWNDLPSKTKTAMKTSGINRGDWDIARRSTKYHSRGVDLLDITELSKHNVDTASKFTGLIRGETFYAAPEPGAKARALSTVGSRPGSVAGELIRTVTQLKSFPIAVLVSHFARASNQGLGGGIAYMAPLVIGTTILGGMAIQAKNLLAGKTTEDWDSPSFIARALAQGGSVGVLTDFIIRDHSRVNSFAEFIGGPLIGDVSVMAALLFGSPTELDEFSENVGARYGSRLKKVFDRAIPDLWFTRVITQRWVKDAYGKLLDPNWTAKQKRMRTAMKDRGQSQWWKSGDMLP